MCTCTITGWIAAIIYNLRKRSINQCRELQLETSVEEGQQLKVHLDSMWGNQIVAGEARKPSAARVQLSAAFNLYVLCPLACVSIYRAQYYEYEVNTLNDMHWVKGGVSIETPVVVLHLVYYGCPLC